jgi:uroporphyrinogen decarboxylase
MKGILTRTSYDHYGITEHFWGETLNDEWPKQGYRKDADPHDVFGYDLRGIAGSPDPTPFRGVNEVIEETDEWQVTRSGWGSALKNWKHHSGTPEHIDFTIKTPADWKPYRDQIADVTDPTRIDFEGIRKTYNERMAQDKFCVFGQVLTFELMRHALGDVTMLESFILEPAWVHDMCRVLTDFYIRHMELIFRDVGKPDGMFIYEDLGFRNGLFASPKTLRELIFPYYKEYVDFLHGHGLPVILHSCGGVTEAVPDLVDIGFDCLQPMEAKAKVNVIDLAKRFGRRIAFMGNIDVTILNTNDRARVKEHVLHVLNTVYDLGADYVFHSDHSIPPDVHYDTYRYAVDLYREFCAGHPMN